MCSYYVKKVDNRLTCVIINNHSGDQLVATAPVVSQRKVIYLNNRDILKQIHLSKNTYCAYLDPVNDHQYDIILPSILKINQRTIAEARRNRSDRIKKETGVDCSQNKHSINIFITSPINR
jgi:hypothetical protein